MAETSSPMKDRLEAHAAAEQAAFERPMTATRQSREEKERTIEPLEYYVLVRLDEIPEKRGNIHLPSQRHEMDQMAQTYATVVKVGPKAFGDFAEEVRPAPGDRVLIDKYGGVRPETTDYTDLLRIIQDKDIQAIVRD